LFIIVLHSY